MNTLSIKSKMIISAIAETNGKIFSVTHKRAKPKTTIVHLITGEKITLAKYNKLNFVEQSMYEVKVEEFSSMTVRTGVKKHLKGGKSTIEAKKDEGLIGVYLMATPEQYKTLSADELKRVSGYRSFYAKDVKSITIQGITTTFDDIK